MLFTYKAFYFLDPEDDKKRNLPLGWELLLIGIIIRVIFIAIPITIISFDWWGCK